MGVGQAEDLEAPGLHLEVIAGNGAGTVIVVEDELLVGRHASGAGKLSEDSEISRHHARMSREASGNYAIEDLDSSNGTFVNGLRIESPQLLAAGDSIEVGGTTLLVRSIIGSAPAASEPASTTPGYAPTIFARTPAPDPPLERPDAEPPAAAAETPPLTLRLEVDFEAREARIALGDGGDTVRLVYEDERWQTRPAGA
ncbi:MAG: fhaB [Solirubrobacterales bacterium]|jgi:pSer/pThr/pTyr-binding forkhead associated (FHA) protein|nr:fhaB [Solirubrobacterales bacterium]